MQQQSSSCCKSYKCTEYGIDELLHPTPLSCTSYEQYFTTSNCTNRVKTSIMDSYISLYSIINTN